ASSPDPTSEPTEPELAPVDSEEGCIPSSSEPEPVSSEVLVADISDAISEVTSPALVSEDLANPEEPLAEVVGSNSSETDASPETPEENFPT
ncbi:hypothetical protein M9458_010269, partial [Cirrhinus mrigala]